jgi:predicted site-specific integrase-resolvase
MDPNDRPILLTKSEIAEFYRVSASTVDKWMKNGRVTPLRTPGGNPRFLLPTIDIPQGPAA